MEDKYSVVPPLGFKGVSMGIRDRWKMDFLVIQIMQSWQGFRFGPTCLLTLYTVFAYYHALFKGVSTEAAFEFGQTC